MKEPYQFESIVCMIIILMGLTPVTIVLLWSLQEVLGAVFLNVSSSLQLLGLACGQNKHIFST